ncbi:MAG: 3-deoxy-8-phosphooctulonate synthase [Chitinispirillaceae bacterium]|nr:3-deoxy-8-phosphooctulonate synthase [Chitinispirillaceae bacterium]
MPIPTFFKQTSAIKPNIFFIAGPCVIESEALCLKIAGRLAALAEKHRIDIVFKASYDKANRLSKHSFRGIGMRKGLRILSKVKSEAGLPVLTDIHEPSHAAEVARVADVLQIPALLCRQTDLLAAAGRTGRWVNIKKGQFMAPEDMGFAIKKAGRKVWLTERGTLFGYRRLVVDFTGIPVMKRFNVPVIFDATHSVQTPGAGNGVSSGNRGLAIPLAKAALAMGVDGLFFEVHPNPDEALCDGPNCLHIKTFETEAPKLVELFRVARGK